MSKITTEFIYKYVQSTKIGSDLGQCDVKLLFHKAFPGTNSAAAAERHDEKRAVAGHLALLQPPFWLELTCRRKIGFLLAREPRVAQNHSLQTHIIIIQTMF
jgi:hypothetical protein